MLKKKEVQSFIFIPIMGLIMMLPIAYDFIYTQFCAVFKKPINTMSAEKEAQTFNYPESLSVIINHFPYALIIINAYQCLVVLFDAFQSSLIPISAYLFPRQNRLLSPLYPN